MRDLVVVGGGPAGLATAIFAAGAGMRVTLVERRRFPVDKPCGEGLMPEGVLRLQEMGVRLGKSRTFAGIRYIEGQRMVEARFHEGPGLGIRRMVLSRAMVDRASELGVEILEATRAGAFVENEDHVRLSLGSGTLESRWLAVADGNGRRVTSTKGFRRFGYRRHYDVQPWSSFVEVHWARGAEAYVTPVSEDEVGVAFLWHEPALTWETMLERFPALVSRLEGRSPTSSVAGAGPMRRRAGAVASPRVALVGDASGYVDALTGNGVALAFECARALVRSLDEGSLSRYRARHRRATRRYRVMTELALTLSRRPRVRHAVLASFSVFPRAFDSLLSFSRETVVE